ncbi:hypothetical protein HMPREF9318_00651 [Streptococcus urinalis FB127-CNA-2]|uniref:Carboxy-cis,cis-muconate cyclase n=1 Tax=Streptococcus urinalis 2285-97 TaxID=764291 RepID=G5KH13_9STRE|nr:carboxy-cis,cis-muconate cyclase [Streptococcus urinalis 2285-97]EKS22453.1 hypothetical protein HMPREF9318_00651 [Streptococcus urinalis FB127-CNA-2]VEF32266.1 3-carboxymuconate cyclase [Streptococcus urinalis]
MCYIGFDADRQLVFGANYHKGQVLAYHYSKTSGLRLTDKIQFKGSGPHPNQEKSHLHFCDLTPDAYLVTCDLGTDMVRTFDISSGGKLKQIAEYHAHSGSGSRHIVFHPHNNKAYLLGELDASVEVLDYLGKGQFQHCQTISSLPHDYSGFNASAAIRLTSDGRFFYVSNRGHDSIASFEVGENGKLTLLAISSSFGKTPRDFNFSMNEDYVIVRHQDSDNVSIFKRDQTNGKLDLISKETIILEAICVAKSQ